MKAQTPMLKRGHRPPPPEVVEVVEEYASALALPGGFDDRAAGWRRPPRDGRLWVINDAAPIPQALFGRIPIIPRTARELVFGHRLPKEACSFIADAKRPGRGKFVRDEDRMAVAEVKRTACYISFDLLAWPGDKAALVLRKVLDAALASFGDQLAARSPLSQDARRLATKTLAQRSMTAEASWSSQREREARDALLRTGRSHSTSRQDYLESEIASLEENIADFSRRITSDSRLLAKYRRELASIEGDEGDEPVDFGQEYDRIREHPLVDRLDVEDDILGVTTLPLTTSYEDERIHLGRFAIEINLNGDVKITNLTRRLWNFDHPHIRDGNPCLGNIQDGVAKLIGTYQLAAVTQVLIDFLQIVNPREWVVSVEYWRES